MGSIAKNLLLSLVLLAQSPRLAIAQPSSTDDEAAVRLDVAKTQAGNGLLVEARATLGKILAIPPKAIDSPPLTVARAKAQKLDDDLRERLGSLRFEVSGLSPGVAPLIYVDESVDPVPAEDPLPVNPGRHVVVAKTPERQVIKTIDARERSTTSVALDFCAPASGEGAERTDTRGIFAGLPSSAKVGIGVGAAGFMVGSVTGILSMITKKPADPRCAASQCPQSSWNDYDPSTKALIRTSTASMIIGVAGVGLAVGSILLHRKHEPSPSPARTIAESVKVTPAAGGMALSGKW